MWKLFITLQSRLWMSGKTPTHIQTCMHTHKHTFTHTRRDTQCANMKTSRTSWNTTKEKSITCCWGPQVASCCDRSTCAGRRPARRGHWLRPPSVLAAEGWPPSTWLLHSPPCGHWGWWGCCLAVRDWLPGNADQTACRIEVWFLMLSQPCSLHQANAHHSNRQ